MKKNSVLFGLIAFVFAITTAFAFKPSPVLNHGYIKNNTCEPTASACGGGTQTCQIDISEDSDPSPVQVFNRDNSCAVLNMP